MVVSIPSQSQDQTTTSANGTSTTETQPTTTEAKSGEKVEEPKVRLFYLIFSWMDSCYHCFLEECGRHCQGDAEMGKEAGKGQ